MHGEQYGWVEHVGCADYFAGCRSVEHQRTDDRLVDCGFFGCREIAVGDAVAIVEQRRWRGVGWR